MESAKVGGVEQVRGAEKQGGIGAIQRSTRNITPEQHQQLMSLIDEEAEKMFGTEGLPESKKETVKGAVKMAIEASMEPDEPE